MSEEKSFAQIFVDEINLGGGNIAPRHNVISNLTLEDRTLVNKRAKTYINRKEAKVSKEAPNKVKLSFSDSSVLVFQDAFLHHSL